MILVKSARSSMRGMRSIALLVGATLLVSGSANLFAARSIAQSGGAPAELASAKILKGVPITPAAATAAYATLGAPATNHTQGLCDSFPANSGVCVNNVVPRPPEIVELARALRHDPALIYEYVHNSIDTEFLFGSHKGPLGAMIDRSGTAFDQAQLMVELLRESGFSSAKYQYGTLNLDAAEFTAWTGISDGKAACDFLAAGGIPFQAASCAAGALTSNITLSHVWVQVTVNGVAVTYDPASKEYEHRVGINLRSAMGVSSNLTAAHTAATQNLSTGGNAVSNFSDQHLGDVLEGYAEDLLVRLNDDDPDAGGAVLIGADMSDVVGGRSILPVHDFVPKTTISNQTGSVTTWSAIPDAYRAKLTVNATRLVGTTSTQQFLTRFFTDEIYGRRLQIYPRAQQDVNTLKYTYYPQLWLDGVKLAEGEGFFETHPTKLTLVLTADHPFAANDPARTGTLDYGDRTATKAANFVMPVAIVHAWGATSENLVNQWQREQAIDGPLVSTQDCNGAPECDLSVPQKSGDLTRARIGAMWLAEYSAAAELHAEIGDSRVQLHHAIGIVAGDFHPTFAPNRTFVTGDAESYGTPVTSQTTGFSVADEAAVLDVEPAYSVVSRTSAAVNRRAVVHAIAMTAATLEGSVLEQISGTPDAASTVARMAWGNSPEALETPATVKREFVSFAAMDSGVATAMASQVVAENKTTGVWGNFVPVDGMTQESVPEIHTAVFKDRLVAEVKAYTDAGYNVTTSTESMLGPGHRHGSQYLVSQRNLTSSYNSYQATNYWSMTNFQPGLQSCPGTVIPTHWPTGPGIGHVGDMPHLDGGGGITGGTQYYCRVSWGSVSGGTSTYSMALNEWKRWASLQVGGALIANKYDASAAVPADEPLEIAHVLTRFTGSAKGGGAPSVTQAATYDPMRAGDALKDRFIDRSAAAGVNISSGRAGWTGPTLRSVGQGEFPYMLESRLELRGDGLPTLDDSRPDGIGPGDHGGVVSNWDGSVEFSGSAHEAMGRSRVQAGAHTVVAFVAMQDVFRSAPSTTREVAAALVADWWRKQISFNVATVTQGGRTEQHIRLFDGSWLPADGGAARLTVTSSLGASGPRRLVRPALRPSPGAGLRAQKESILRVWKEGDATGAGYLTIKLRGPNGDVRDFEYWSQGMPSGPTQESNFTGWRLKKWTWPQGVELTLVYGDTGNIALPTRVESNMGYGLDIVRMSGGMYASGASAPSTGLTIHNAAGEVTKVAFRGPVERTTTARPDATYGIAALYAPDRPFSPSLQYTYDNAGRIMEARDAVALEGQRPPHLFFIAEGYRGSRSAPKTNPHPAYVEPAYTVEWTRSGRTERHIDELGRITTTLKDGRGRIVEQIFPEEDKVQYRYDSRDNPIEMKRFGKPGTPEFTTPITIQAAWHANWNKPIWIKDAAGKQTDFEYYEEGLIEDGDSLLRYARRPEPQVGSGRPTYEFEYSNRGLLTASKVPGPAIETDTLTTAALTQTPVGVRPAVQTVNTYDSLGFLTSSCVGPGAAAGGASPTCSYFTPDGVTGNVVARWDGRGQAVSGWTMQYDAMRRLTREDGPENAATKYTFDAAGRVTKTEKLLRVAGQPDTWQTVRTGYTLTGQPAWVEDPSGDVTLMEYDHHDRKAKVTSPNGDVTAFVYNAAGELLQEKRGVGASLAQTYALFTYTANGQRASLQNARGNVTVFTYDGFDRPKRTTYPDGSYEEAVTYDLTGNLLRRRVRWGSSIPQAGAALFVDATYDFLGRKLTEKGLWADQYGVATSTPAYTNESWRMRDREFAYDLAGRIRFARTDQVTRSWRYDEAGRPYRHVTNQGSGFEYRWDAAGNLASTIYGVSVAALNSTSSANRKASFQYDGLSRMTNAAFALTHGGSPVATATINYDSLSRRTKVTFGDGSTQSYAWQIDGDLSDMAHVFPSRPADNVTFTYPYDQASRQSGEIVDNAAYEYVPPLGETTFGPANAADQVTSLNSNPLVWAAEGRLFRDNVLQFRYDQLGNMTLAHLQANAGDGERFQTDALGERQYSRRYIPSDGDPGNPSDTDPATRMFSDGLRSEVVLERLYIIPEGGAQAAAGSRYYVLGPNPDERLIYVDENDVVSYPHTDRRNSTIALSREGKAEAKFVYGPSGESTDSETGYPWRYTGQRLDSFSKLYHYKTRAYSPTLGQFVQPDSAGFADGPNLYVYANDDPLNLVDPDGRQAAPSTAPPPPPLRPGERTPGDRQPAPANDNDGATGPLGFFRALLNSTSAGGAAYVMSQESFEQGRRLKLKEEYERDPSQFVLVVRWYGGDSKWDGRSWAPAWGAQVDNPRNLFGIPDGTDPTKQSWGVNTMDRIEFGAIRVRDIQNGNIVMQRPAIPYGSYTGGGQEYVIRQPYAVVDVVVIYADRRWGGKK